MDLGIPILWRLGVGWRHSSGKKQVFHKLKIYTPKVYIFTELELVIFDWNKKASV